MGVHPIRSLARVAFWQYPRGSWQYDILCVLIIGFIFLTPKGLFDGSYFADKAAGETVPAVGGEESGGPEEKDEVPQPSAPPTGSR